MKAPSFEASHLLLDTEGKIVRCEQDFGDWLGLALEELMGHRLQLILTSRQPEWQPLFESEFHRKEQSFVFLGG